MWYIHEKVDIPTMESRRSRPNAEIRNATSGGFIYPTISLCRYWGPAHLPLTDGEPKASLVIRSCRDTAVARNRRLCYRFPLLYPARAALWLQGSYQPPIRPSANVPTSKVEWVGRNVGIWNWAYFPRKSLKYVSTARGMPYIYTQVVLDKRACRTATSNYS